jgi:hypothetical protein
MIGIVVQFLLFAFVCVPLFTFLHEMGHALFQVRQTEGRVTVRVGSPPPFWKWKWGRIHVQFSLFYGHLGLSRIERHTVRLDARARCLIALGGPLATLLTLLLAYLVLLDIPRDAGGYDFVKYCCYYLLFQLLITGLPLRYPAWYREHADAGRFSDGHQAIQQWKRLRQERREKRRQA